MFRAPKLLGNVQIVRKLKHFFVKVLGSGILPVQLPLFSLFPTAVIRLKQKMSCREGSVFTLGKKCHQIMAMACDGCVAACFTSMQLLQ